MRAIVMHAVFASDGEGPVAIFDRRADALTWAQFATAARARQHNVKVQAIAFEPRQTRPSARRQPAARTGWPAVRRRAELARAHAYWSRRDDPAATPA